MAAVEITIDEKSCRGCSLCVEICPTAVFSFNESNKLAVVENSSECFGCLSCCEICPSGAISHNFLDVSESYYHDSGALDMARRLGEQRFSINAPNDPDKIENVIIDLGIRLLSVAAVLKHTFGQSLPAIGTMAGKSLATQLPLYQKPETIEDALALTQRTFAPAWVMNFELDGDKLTVWVKDCFVRDLCHKEKLELGGDLCVLFYNYLAGYLGKVCSIRPRLMGVERGDTCSYSVKVYQTGPL